jgi:hypothetical protein
MLARDHVPDPPAGSVEVAIVPSMPAATHRAVDGQATLFSSAAVAVLVHAVAPPVGLVAVKIPAPPPTHSDADGHAIADGPAWNVLSRIAADHAPEPPVGFAVLRTDP